MIRIQPSFQIECSANALSSSIKTEKKKNLASARFSQTLRIISRRSTSRTIRISRRLDWIRTQYMLATSYLDSCLLSPSQLQFILSVKLEVLPITGRRMRKDKKSTTIGCVSRTIRVKPIEKGGLRSSTLLLKYKTFK